MSSVESWRKEAAELRDGANIILAPENAEKLKADQRQFIAAIVGKLGAMILEAKADVVEAVIAAAGSTDPAMIKRRAIMEKNNAIRRAAASGNWAEFDRLAAETGGPS